MTMKLTYGYQFYRLDNQLHISASGDKTLCGRRRPPYSASPRSNEKVCPACRINYRHMTEVERLKKAGHVAEDGRLVF